MFNPKQLQAMMRRLGISTKEIDCEEVVILCKDKKIVITNPSVALISYGNEKTFQITGNIHEERIEQYQISDEDLKFVIEQTNADEETARKLLIKNKGDIAKTILELKKE